jgi:hypothetical protein
VTVNGQAADFLASMSGVVDWQATLDVPRDGSIMAFAQDESGNIEQTAHRLRLDQ